MCIVPQMHQTLGFYRGINGVMLMKSLVNAPVSVLSSLIACLPWPSSTPLNELINLDTKDTPKTHIPSCRTMIEEPMNYVRTSLNRHEFGLYRHIKRLFYSHYESKIPLSNPDIANSSVLLTAWPNPPNLLSSILGEPRMVEK